MHNEVVIVGAFHEIVELCEFNACRIVGVIDNNLKGEFLGYPIIGSDSDAQTLYPIYGKYPVIITPDLPKVREKLYSFYKSLGFLFTSLINKDAYISPSAKLGEGIIVQNKVYISSSSIIGNFVKLNVGATLMHDVVINDFSTMAPNSTALGCVKIGRNCYIGANATILPYVEVSSDVTIGAGAVVTRNVDAYKTVKGVPAK